MQPHAWSKWWVRALTISVVWSALIIGVGIVHTNVVLAGRLTLQQDELISNRYGIVCGAGLVLIWLYFWRGRPAT